MYHLSSGTNELRMHQKYLESCIKNSDQHENQTLNAEHYLPVITKDTDSEDEFE